MRVKRTEEEVQDLLQRYESRGAVTRRAFCEREGVAVSTLAYYLARRAKPATRLARVRIATESSPEAGRYTLVLANGRRIECGVAELPQLISVAERG